MLALADCNNFYATCERVFDPRLRGRPVVVLSNNDGCVVARSAEAKDLKIPMGVPAFQWERFFRANGVAVRSSNYALYGDLSSRVMRILSRLAPRTEIYSIDEAFLDLGGLHDVEDHCRAIRAEVLRCTGITLSLGLASTKTLAKVANNHAKKHASDGVFRLHADNTDSLLDDLDVGAVWGVGRRKAATLHRHGIRTARLLRDADADWVRRTLSVVTLHTVMELRGRPCIDLDAAPAPHRAIRSSRCFGQALTAKPDIREALAHYTTRAAEKLRRQGSAAALVSVYLRTNEHKDEPQYNNLAERRLPFATCDTAALIRAATGALDEIYRPGYRYKKAGVILSGLEQENARQGTLLEELREDPTRRRLMDALDAVNARFGSGTVRCAAEGTPGRKIWTMRQAHRSPEYTTAWDQLPVVQAKG